jgi:hypothetical protein
MSRSTMAALIGRVRTLISDSGGSPQFTDDQVQDALDATRTDYDYLLLEPHPTMHNGSATTYALFVAPTGGGWESDYVLYDSSWAAVANDPSNEVVNDGRFVRDSSNTDRFLYICGKQYDIYDAAAELCETWASELKGQYDLQTGAGVLGRHRSALSQKYGQTAATAQLMRSRSRMKAVWAVRRDIRAGM